MRDEWFYRIGQAEHGPVSRDEIAAMCRNGTISQTDRIRNIDLDWSAPSSGLFDPPEPAKVVRPGIRGWLLAQAIGFGVGLPVLLLVLLDAVADYNDAPTSRLLKYLVVQAVWYLFACFTAVRFFMRKSNAPKFLIIMWIFTAVTKYVAPDPSMATSEAVRMASTQTAIAIVWIIYYLRSERVRVTFTR